MQIIELAANTRKEKTKFIDGHGVCFKCKEQKPEVEFTLDPRRQNGYANICKPCERQRGRDKYQRLYKKRSTGK